MIVRFFKASYFSRLIVIILLVLLLWFPESAYYPDNFFHFSDLNPLVLQLISVSVFFLTALFANEIATSHRFTGRNSYLTAFLFILLGSGSGFLTQPSPFLAASLFFVFFYRKVYSFQNSSKIITTAFDAGLFLGITSLFFPPAVLMLPFVWIALLIYQVDRWRAYVTSLLGLLVPWFFVFTGYYWFNKLPEAVTEFIQYFHFREMENPFSGTFDLVIFLLVSLIIFVAAFSLIGRMSSLNIGLRQHASVSLWGLLFPVSVIILLAVPIQALTILVIPASFVAGAFFSRLKRLKWANLLIMLWLLLILINHYLPLFYAAPTLQ